MMVMRHLVTRDAAIGTTDAACPTGPIRGKTTGVVVVRQVALL